MIDLNDYNQILAAWREGRLSSFNLSQLRVMSTRCNVFIQNAYGDAAHAKAAIVKEIERKEAQELHRDAESNAHRRHEESMAFDQEKLREISSVNEQIATITGRVKAIENLTRRSEFKIWSFWIALLALLVGGASLLRDYWGWSGTRFTNSRSTIETNATLSGSNSLPRVTTQ